MKIPRNFQVTVTTIWAFTYENDEERKTRNERATDNEKKVAKEIEN